MLALLHLDRFSLPTRRTPIIRVAAVCGVLLAVLASFGVQARHRRKESVLSEDVGRAVSELAPAADIDPGFVSALAWEQNGLNARAQLGGTRYYAVDEAGLKEVTDELNRLA